MEGPANSRMLCKVSRHFRPVAGFQRNSERRRRETLGGYAPPENFENLGAL